MNAKKSNYPNLFIVGAPRCGTTSLHYYLGQHPDIFMSEPKEPYYFLTDLPHQERFERDAYLKLFSGCGDVSYAGEASVLYLRSETAAAEIHSFCPQARVIIMLRNPVDLMYSLHSHCLRTANEDIFDFEEALAAETDRKRGLRIPSTAFFPHALRYREMVDFVPQVKRYLDTFDQDSVRVIIYDDFVADPLKTYRELLAWLDVDEAFLPDLEPQNSAAPIPNLFIQRQFHGNPLFKFLRRLLQVLVTDHRMRKTIKVVFGRLTQRQPESKVNPELRRQLLLGKMRSDIDSLGELIGRDLGNWYRDYL